MRSPAGGTQSAFSFSPSVWRTLLLVTVFVLFMIVVFRSWRDTEALHEREASNAQLVQLKARIEALSERARSADVKFVELADKERIIKEHSGRIRRLEGRQDKILKSVEPWERCLRFNFERTCDESQPDDVSKPPCMTRILAQMAKDMSDALQASDVTHWVSFGTLLGAVRHQRVLEWTADVDVVIAAEEFAGMGEKLQRDGKIAKRGYLFFYDKKYPTIARACITAAAGERYTKHEILDVEKVEYYDKYPYIDLYQTKEPTQNARTGKGKVNVIWGPPCTYDAATVFPLQKIPLYDRMVFAPNNTTRYLTQLYGPDFMTPPEKGLRTGHGFYTNACKKEWSNL